MSVIPRLACIKEGGHNEFAKEQYTNVVSREEGNNEEAGGGRRAHTTSEPHTWHVNPDQDKDMGMGMNMNMGRSRNSSFTK